MTHEPECPISGIDPYSAQNEWQSIDYPDCICENLRAAYQRGDAAGYRRGREDAAEAVLACGNDEHRHAYADAARGDGEQA